jgi:hypothetical protein
MFIHSYLKPNFIMFLVTDFFTLILGFMRKGTAIERIPDNYMAQTEHVGLVMSLGGAWYV